MVDEAKVRDALIVALDCEKDEALQLAKQISGRAGWVKVGMTLFYREGPAIVSFMSELGLKVFLDLKLHDIPFQVRGAACSAALSGADLLSIHAFGGSDMIREALCGVEEAAEQLSVARAQLVAISVLTSMDQQALNSIGVSLALSQEVENLAKLSYQAGADGIVCSPQEAHSMRSLLGVDALIVTPGVRPKGSDVGDQARVATPAQAIAAGASKLVVGRPITHAHDPIAAVEAIVEEILVP